MEKLLSIVVPAYNVEKYLGQCLASFENEKILNDIEVLIIDDGSADKTGEIAKKYCLKYPDTYILHQKENGGHGSGINYGIRYARGKYFKVVDGDDWVDKNELEKFVLTLKKQNADIIASDFKCIQDETFQVLEEKKCTDIQEQYGTVCSMAEGEIKRVIKMHSLTIKTAILQEHKIHIDEKCYYVDCEYITYPIPYVDSVYFYNGCLYMYRLGREGQSVNIKSMQKNREQHMYVLKQLLHFYGRLTDLKDGSKKYMEHCIAQMVENQFQIYISMGWKNGSLREMRNFDKNLRKDYPSVYNATQKRSIDLLRKTNYVILPLGTLVYKIVK